MEKKYYLEFRAPDNDRFQMLQKVFYELKKSKEGGGIDADDGGWKTFFDEKTMKHFLTEEEFKKVSKMPRASLFQFKPNKWHFESMLDAVNNCECELVSCELFSEKDRVARMEFYPISYPYGGTDALQCLIEAFGFKVTAKSE
jgi:hypothetical protein